MLHGKHLLLVKIGLKTLNFASLSWLSGYIEILLVTQFELLNAHNALVYKHDKCR